MRRNVTLRDVADRASCNLTTVSKVLSGSTTLKIRPETRQRIVQAAQELGYRGNALARGLKLARSDTIGLVVPDTANPIYGDLVRGAQHEARVRGVVLLISHTDDETSFERIYGELVLAGRVDGLIVATARTHDLTLEQTIGRHDRVVLVNNMHPKIPSVIAQDGEAVRMASIHLHDHGHRRISFVGGPATADTSQRRVAGYLKAQKEAGFEPHLMEAGWTERDGYLAADALILANPRPTGIVAVNSRVAFGIMARAHELGIQIPARLSIIGVQDVPQADYWQPRLTTVKLPLYEMAQHALRMMLDEPADELLHVVQIAPKLIVRASVGVCRDNTAL
jgi:LacI family transcriptional regulator